VPGKIKDMLENRSYFQIPSTEQNPYAQLPFCDRERAQVLAAAGIMRYLHPEVQIKILQINTDIIRLAKLSGTENGQEFADKYTQVTREIALGYAVESEKITKSLDCILESSRILFPEIGRKASTLETTP
jgi:hypothetical protein